MKRLIMLGVGLGALVSIASAAPLCVTDTMAAYMALPGGCTIGSMLFSNFGYSSTGMPPGGAVPSDQVLLTPNSSDPFNPGIIFSSRGWVVPAGSIDFFSFVDSSISFTVSGPPGGLLIADSSMTLLGFSVTGDGHADIAETVLPAGMGLDVNSDGPLYSHVNFTPTASVSVAKDLIVLVPQGQQGSAIITSFEENFSLTPEPIGMVLIGSGLVAVALMNRRFRRR